jgi:hypothetical protein
MNTAVLGALAALSGSALGGIAPLISNYLVQRGLTEREMLSQELAVRQELYSDFIQFGIKVWVSATTKQLAGEGMDDLINDKRPSIQDFVSSLADISVDIEDAPQPGAGQDSSF